ncbi:DNA/RNA non-specific endonuclease [Secundilactobacillus hailunensis]|uniref:DNA/RNA non-specific endonuclease n=1 Tax=Secundilactobacillus hailunensis TaxID=2559923 RepID=A0ABW1T9L3_9LACO|nr:DNA/RNA non-specific endonuclease [Secundilactobacillus hailunensis]
MSSLGMILLLISIILFGYWGSRRFKHLPTKRTGWSAIILLVLAFVIGGTSGNHSATKSASDQSSSKAELKDSSSSASSHRSHTKTTRRAKPSSTKKSSQSNHQDHTSVLNKLVSYTDKESAGPTGNYYWHVGKAHLTGFKSLGTSSPRFTADAEQRPAAARAKLTYQEYASSRGGRQGDPLEPYAWPSNNPIVAISYAATGRTYHGYLWNRSHSIGDSLLGAKSYTSVNNFTTGTRPQNVGADQDGGMRYGEETVENYWSDHPDTHQTVDYQTTPIYKGNESIPRGSLVDIKSSDGTINTEIAVINDAEGIKINYNTGANNAKPYHRSQATPYQHHSTTSSNQGYQDSTTHSQATTSGKWHVAPAGHVYVSKSNKYYTRVTNPQNYTKETKAQAKAAGATEALRGNEYAQP